MKHPIMLILSMEMEDVLLREAGMLYHYEVRANGPVSPLINEINTGVDNLLEGPPAISPVNVEP